MEEYKGIINELISKSPVLFFIITKVEFGINVVINLYGYFPFHNLTVRSLEQEAILLLSISITL